MKLILESPYKEDYKSGYLITNLEKRRMVCLVGFDNKRLTTSYARYLLAVKHKRYLTDNEQADHIDEDKTNDSLDNLQILSAKANNLKGRKPKKLFNFVCPVCSKEFKLTASESHRENPTCSRKCGGIKSHITLACKGEAKEPITVRCACGKDFQVKPSRYRLRVKRNKENKIYCSRACGTRFSPR